MTTFQTALLAGIALVIALGLGTIIRKLDEIKNKLE